VIFSPLKDSDFGWYKEKDARIAFHEDSYIQPDIGGRDRNKFFPRSAYPNIIIEVIFSPLKDSDFGWYKEKDARIAFHEDSYIQPD
ncbi:hypothetical protein KXT57_24445, partial [Salmonella enterica subsp. enterica serovar Weltevreden]|nr:hypothetical protein [Salmonella enterica subsp. enterica serovar Weltevreden]